MTDVSKLNLGKLSLSCRNFTVEDLVDYTEKPSGGRIWVWFRFLFTGKGFVTLDQAKKLLNDHKDKQAILDKFPSLERLVKTHHVGLQTIPHASELPKKQTIKNPSFDNNLKDLPTDIKTTAEEIKPLQNTIFPMSPFENQEGLEIKQVEKQISSEPVPPKIDLPKEVNFDEELKSHKTPNEEVPEIPIPSEKVDENDWKKKLQLPATCINLKENTYLWFTKEKFMEKKFPERIKHELPEATYYCIFSAAERTEIFDEDFEKFANLFKESTLPIVILSYRLGPTDLGTPKGYEKYPIVNLRFSYLGDVHDSDNNVQAIQKLKEKHPELT